MPEDKESATEEPTAKRLSEAHERGQFAKSPELTVVTGLVAAYFVFLIFAGQDAKQMAEFMAAVLSNLANISVSEDSFPGYMQSGAMMLFVWLAPLMGLSFLLTIAAGAFQTGFRMTSKVMELDPNKLNPVSGFKRIISKEGFVKLGLESAKLIVVGTLIYGGVRQIMDDPIFYTPVPLTRLITFIYDTTMMLLLRFAAAMAALGAINYLYQKFKTRKELMMTQQEVKDESKQATGNPEIKVAQRQFARRLLQKQMLSAVPTADVIVTNPTHYAVALRYERGKDAAPVVLAKGHNLFAQRIKAIGKEHSVPTVENKPVARALFKYGKVGEPIPAQLYQAIAEILGYVYRTHRYYFHQLKIRRAAESSSSSP